MILRLSILTLYVLASIPVRAASPVGEVAASTESLKGFTRRLDRAREVYAGIRDYTATLQMRERVDGRMAPTSRGVFKFRKPFAVYIKWDQGTNKGLEALYVRGKYDGELVVHPPGLIGFKTYWLDPKGSTAMRGNRHPITEAGIGNMLEILERNRRLAVTQGRAQVRALPEQPIPGPAGPRYELTITGPHSPAYYCRRAIVTFDPKTELLSAALIYDWRNVLVEDYRYFNIRPNAGLTDRDFDVENPKYNF